MAALQQQKKFNTKKENCKQIYIYFTQSKNCLALNFQTYYEDKNEEYEKQHDLILNAISDKIFFKYYYQRTRLEKL